MDVLLTGEWWLTAPQNFDAPRRTRPPSAKLSGPSPASNLEGRKPNQVVAERKRDRTHTRTALVGLSGSCSCPVISGQCPKPADVLPSVQQMQISTLSPPKTIRPSATSAKSVMAFFTVPHFPAVANGSPGGGFPSPTCLSAVIKMKVMFLLLMPLLQNLCFPRADGRMEVQESSLTLITVTEIVVETPKAVQCFSGGLSLRAMFSVQMIAGDQGDTLLWLWLSAA